MIEKPLVWIALSLYSSVYKLLEKDYIWTEHPNHKDYYAIVERFTITNKVIILGLNPSDDSPDNSAFHPDTKSGKTVRVWIKDIEGHVVFRNIYTKKGKPTKSQVYAHLGGDLAIYQKLGWKIVACGTVVQDTLRKNSIPHFAIPHPSGLNRFWNDKQAGAAKIAELRTWIQNK